MVSYLILLITEHSDTAHVVDQTEHFTGGVWAGVTQHESRLPHPIAYQCIATTG